MNLDELHREWRATNEAAATQEQRDRLITATYRRVERFWESIYRRDLGETIRATATEYDYLALSRILDKG